MPDGLQGLAAWLPTEPDLLAGRAYGRTSQSITEPLRNAFQGVERHGSRPLPLVVSPRTMSRIFQELAEGSAYLVDPSQLRMAHQGVHPITASASVDPSADEIPPDTAVTNNVLPSRRTVWDRLLDDTFLGEVV